MGVTNRILAAGAAGAAIYGITRGVQNGTFQRLPETINNALNNNGQMQQFTQPIRNMVNQNQNQSQNQNMMQPTNAVQNAVQTFAEDDNNNSVMYEQ
ncbi:hypothetical protein SAMN04487943_101697 [Gracilibacillus orientalis]|uniref:Uncharacterized protein n=1 Tax=Gracilibacillus orientalis TaxID=334253 RepID=A0A1I4HWX5_9BACI|nr:hypothetical protein [Gracilibacillus orientalis]SFL46712.1 hypothetical protein SAMN04487943_101697 [Gracilibacillus orientalis]